MRVALLKERISGVVRCGRQFGVRGVREAEWKSKGVKQARSGGWHKQRQRGNHIILEREHVDGVRLQRPVRVSAGIDGESGLPVGRRRYQAKAATSLPSHRKEGADRLAPRSEEHTSELQSLRHLV